MVPGDCNYLTLDKNGTPYQMWFLNRWGKSVLCNVVDWTFYILGCVLSILYIILFHIFVNILVISCSILLAFMKLLVDVTEV